MDKAEIKARAVEAQAYAAAASTVLEGAAQTDRVKEARKMLEHAKKALYELDELIDVETGK